MKTENKELTIAEEFEASMAKLKEINNKENLTRFMLATARAFRQGIGLSGEEIRQTIDKVYEG